MAQLDELQVGDHATVTGYTDSGIGYRRKLQALGLRPGARINVLRRATADVHLALLVRGLTVILHPEEAVALAVDKSPTPRFNACKGNPMNDPQTQQPPARMVAGALAHLVRHMETGCPRAGYLAALLLEQVANDPEADAHLRRHARELVEILDRDQGDAHDSAPQALRHPEHERAMRIAAER